MHGQPNIKFTFLVCFYPTLHWTDCTVSTYPLMSVSLGVRQPALASFCRNEVTHEMHNHLNRLLFIYTLLGL